MAQSVVVKKEEKVNKIFAELGVDCSFEEFFDKDVYKRQVQEDTLYRNLQTGALTGCPFSFGKVRDFIMKEFWNTI